jgi:hypothetical protein
LTKPRTTAPLCILLDANVIFEAYRQGIWQSLLQKVHIVVPSIVVRDEALFVDIDGTILPLRLVDEVRAGKLEEIAVEGAALAYVQRFFDQAFVEGLHEGEMEALAIVHTSEETMLFCTADQVAIQALAMMDHADKGVSFEGLLRKTGLWRKMERHFGERYFKEHTERGRARRIRGEGLNR